MAQDIPKICVVQFSFDGGISEMIRDGLLRMQDAAAQEPGCLSYRFSIDLAAPNSVRLIEHWRDQAAFDTHVGNARSAEFFLWLKSAGVRDFTLQQHDVGCSTEPRKIDG